MIGLTKKEIADNLLDFVILKSKMQTCPNRKISTLYKEIILERQQRGMDVNNYDENSYLVMLRIYFIINTLKLFSYYEERFFDSIDNIGLDFSNFKKNIKDGGCFVEGNGKSFSNKQIILYIRNAFNHNDDIGHNKFNISRNAKYIEVHLKDVRKEEEIKKYPNNKKPFHIKMSYDTLKHLFSMMSENVQNYDISFYTSNLGNLVPDTINDEYIDSLSINRVILQKKVSDEVLAQILQINSNNSLPKEEKISQTNDILLTNGVKYKIESYPLDPYQKRAIRILFSTDDKFNSQILDHLLDKAIRNYTPLGLAKTINIKNELFLLNLFGNPNMTYEEFINSANKIIFNKTEDMNDLEKKLAEKKGKNVVELVELSSTLNLYMKKSPYLTYIAYVIANMYDSNSEIIINGINREHIRNSLTHGWYFIDQNNNLMLYDNYDRRKNDYEFYWHKSVSFVELLNVVIGKNHTEIKAVGSKKK